MSRSSITGSRWKGEVEEGVGLAYYHSVEHERAISIDDIHTFLALRPTGLTMNFDLSIIGWTLV